MEDEWVVEMPTTTGTGKGYCQVCGEPAPTPQGTWCTDHHPNNNKPVRQDKIADKVKKRVITTTSTGKVTAAKAAGSFSKLIIIISAIWAYTLVKRYGIPDVDGTLADDLAFTDEEAADIARPIGRLTMSNATAAKFVGPVVENDDLIDALFSLYEWRKRVDQTLAQYKGNQIQDNQRSRSVSTQSDEVSTSSSGGDGSLPYYDGQADFRTVV